MVAVAQGLEFLLQERPCTAPAKGGPQEEAKDRSSQCQGGLLTGAHHTLHLALAPVLPPLQVGVCLREGLPNLIKWPHQQRVCEAQGPGRDPIPRLQCSGLGCGRLRLPSTGKLHTPPPWTLTSLWSGHGQPSLASPNCIRGRSSRVPSAHSNPVEGGGF